MKITSLILVWVLAMPVGAEAQDSRDQLTPGLRVRIFAAELGQQMYVGEVSEIDQCMHVRVSWGRGIMGVPLSRIGRLEVSGSGAERLLVLPGEPADAVEGPWRTVNLARLRQDHDQRCQEPPFREVTPLMQSVGGTLVTF